MQIDNVFIRPVMTEKATQFVGRKIYTFEVNPKATKTQIAAALKKLYPVKVGAIRTVTRQGKTRRTGKKMVPQKMNNRKIAYITVTEGKIDLFPQA